MIVTDKVIRLEVTKPYNQSALRRILELVQNASERKAPAELFIRKFAPHLYTNRNRTGFSDCPYTLSLFTGTAGLPVHL